jgi:hypothetical protein
MKQYPYIQSSTGTKFRELNNAYVFDKIDGSNLRFEWSRKRGWYKYGTRHRLFDESDEVFGPAILLFHSSMGYSIDRVLRKGNHQSAVAFAEYAGKQSFAGQHIPGDMMWLYLFDIALDKKGLIGPKQFVDTFSDVCLIPNVLGTGLHWTRNCVEMVKYAGQPDHPLQWSGITFEGVVVKSIEGRQLIMTKAKTKQWIDKVKKLYEPKVAEQIINS